MKLSKPRRQLLEDLAKDTMVPAYRLTVPARGLATRMQRDGLVQWHAPVGSSSRHTCLGQFVSITDVGRAALTQG